MRRRTLSNTVAKAAEVRTRADFRRFELVLDGVPAGYTTFRDLDRVRVFLETRISSAFDDLGLGVRLIGEALDETWAAGMRVDPQCPDVRRFIAKRQEYADLVCDRRSPHRLTAGRA